ncbi:hypothetical protein ACPCSP_20240 [Streptomyces cinereoruber]|uniref:hypothetical protein n=1 Tax=Streptomyces cinereoruber TaxID=67260 RepID=UPI003C2BEA4D
MTLFSAFLYYGAAVDTVLDAAPVWAPSLLAGLALGAGVRRVPRPVRTRPDRSGPTPHPCPDCPSREGR